MALINEGIKRSLARSFAQRLDNHVKLLVFTSLKSYVLSDEVLELAKEIANISGGKVDFRVVDFDVDRSIVDKYGVKRAPAMIPVGKIDIPIMFYGLPIGSELDTLIDAIFFVSRKGWQTTQQRTSIYEKTGNGKTMNSDFGTRLHSLQIFVSPGCSRCRSPVRKAMALALAGKVGMVDVINTVDFPDLTKKYRVRTVPTIIEE